MKLWTGFEWLSPVASSYEDDNETPSTVRGREFTDQLSVCQLNKLLTHTLLVSVTLTEVQT